VQVSYAPGSGISLEGREFELRQFHFHEPSEHSVRGALFAMEAHLVHEAANGDLAVVGVMIVEGPENRTLAQAWERMPAVGESHVLPVPVSAEGLLPAGRGYLRYEGSLTTPPCTEGVRWVVLAEPVTASRQQIDAFAHALHHPNNRPPQPLNGRAILREADAASRG
jgi:carbonic anhydrase